jgi:hypothetical protein
MLKEATGRERNRVFIASEIIAIIEAYYSPHGRGYA